MFGTTVGKRVCDHCKDLTNGTISARPYLLYTSYSIIGDASEPADAHSEISYKFTFREKYYNFLFPPGFNSADQLDAAGTGKPCSTIFRSEAVKQFAAVIAITHGRNTIHFCSSSYLGLTSVFSKRLANIYCLIENQVLVLYS